ncbi:unnamed protein product [Macrosiphum euphorbiae]|uniref:DUF4371 domain-containing protein n=1 Tax=Macrosiphum euphorbiae TaxID=13131 RepID=A0AAV0XMZ7_9HEMI|nr:unnamed protein product [Macrosiphum euphorbiae]
MRKTIKNELGDRQFSIQVDSTQDIGTIDQAAICLRYVSNSQIKERLFSVVQVKTSSGKGLYELLKECFSQNDINFKNIIGSSFDGAANMQGEFNGLRAFIKQENQNSVYIWCYAHILNLCVCDTCENLAAKNLFGLLNRLATFFSDSYKKMGVWKEIQEKLTTGQNKLKKLQKIGETRWWSREKALLWMFDGNDCLYPIVINALDFVATSKTFDPKSISEANSLKEKLCQFNIIVTAHLFLPIFKSIGPTSTYLQSKNLDILNAFLMVDKCIADISNLKFENVLKSSKDFVLKMNNSLHKIALNKEIFIENDFPKNRRRIKKLMFDEVCDDEAPTDPKQKFRVEVFQCIIDQLRTSLTERFTNNKSLVADMQYLLPKHYNDIRNKLIPKSALQKLSLLSSVDHSKLIDELEHFAGIYDKISKPLYKKTVDIYDENTNNDDDNLIVTDMDYEDFSLDWDDTHLSVTGN